MITRKNQFTDVLSLRPACRLFMYPCIHVSTSYLKDVEVLEENTLPLTASINNRIADVTHVGLTCWGLGYERAMDVAAWNAVTWGNVGFTVSGRSFNSTGTQAHLNISDPTSDLSSSDSIGLSSRYVRT